MLRFALAIAVLCSCLFSSSAEAQPLKKVFAPVKKLAQCVGGNCQQSATVTGFVVVGQADTDGAIVTYTGPVVDPVPNMAPLAFVPMPSLAPTLPAESSILAKRADFRQVFLKAVRKARDDGEINAFQHGRLVVAALRPRELANIQAWVHENAIQEGLASAQAPDWNAIIDFIERLIPLIIQLIDLFGSNTQAHLNEAQYALRNPVIESQTACDWSGLAG